MNSEHIERPLEKFLRRRAKNGVSFAGVRWPRFFELRLKYHNWRILRLDGEASLRYGQKFFEKHMLPNMMPNWGKEQFDRFLNEEGRRERRIIDIPDPTYREGYVELLGFIAEIIDSKHKPSIKVAFASLEVEMDCSVERDNNSVGVGPDQRRLRRMREVIEKVGAALIDEPEVRQSFYCPKVSPIFVPVKAAYDELIKFIADHPRVIFELRPRQLEGLIAEVIKGYGWEVHLTPETHDGGYDILAVSKDINGVKTSMIVECKLKKPEHKIGIGVARQLLQVKSEQKASYALLVSTSEFTKGVYEYAAKRLDFDVKNFEAIIEWCKEYSR